MIEDNEPPVFILASERSGTNLLRVLLTKHQDTYFGPSPGHFLKWLYPRLALYGDLKQDENFKHLAKDAYDLCRVHFAPWEWEIEIDELIDGYDKAYDKRDLQMLVHYMHLLYARKKGSRSYICKDNCLAEHVFYLNRAHPSARFIHLYRDPRDVMASEMSRPRQRKMVRTCIANWKAEQSDCLTAAITLGPEKVHSISYEEMASDPEKSIRSVCEFLGVDYRAEARDSAEITNSDKVSDWKNLDKPVFTSSIGKYKTGLKGYQLRIVEQATAGLIKRLGYQLESTEDHPSSSRTDIALDLIDFVRRRVVESFSKGGAENELRSERRRLTRSLPK